MKRVYGYWTKERVAASALKFKIRKNWKKKYMGAHFAACKNGWLNEVTAHMKYITKPSGYWTKERVINEALKYNTIKSWRNNCSSSYSIAHRNGWLHLATAHMKELGNLKKRLIYVYEFPDNIAYVGLTCDSQRRIDSHFNSDHSPVFNYINKTGKKPIYKELTPLVSVFKIKKLEKKYIKEYRKNGWSLLNKNDGGALGLGLVKWNKENVAISALKFKTRKKWKDAFKGAYHAACRNGWLNEVTTHMVYITKPIGYWTKEKVLKSAKKYKTKENWRKGCNGAASAARKNGWYLEATKHMIDQRLRK